MKRPFGGPQYVLQYLGRYTHLVAISNHRLCVVGIGKSDANAIAAHNPTRTRHYGSEKIPELESGNQVIGQLKEKSNTLVLLQQLLL